MSESCPKPGKSTKVAKRARKRARKSGIPEHCQHGSHGLYALKGTLKTLGQRDDWLKPLGELGNALRAWRQELVEALGGEEAVTPQQRSIIDLASRTHLMLESVDQYVLSMGSLVNKRRRALFPVVRERQQLADSLARYMAQLGLERRSIPTPSLSEYFEQKAEDHDEPRASQHD